MRVGLFGGSFNPVHLGHLRAAEEVREALKLDLVYFIPAASPPHKESGGLAPADHRLRMVQLATKGNRHFMVSDAEVRRTGRSYTVDTVRSFTSVVRQPGTLFLMMGTDALVELHTWKEPQEIIRLCHLVVHHRPDAEGQDAWAPIVAAADKLGYIREQEHYVHPDGFSLTFVPTTFYPISASAIREKLKASRSARYMLPSDVLDYIERHGLY